VNFDGIRARATAFADGLSLLVQWVLYLAVKALSPFWNRDETLWAFGARGGEAFADNAKYLFLHVAAERPGVRPVWLSKDSEVVAELQAGGYEAYHCYSLRGLLTNLRAGVVFLTHGHRDLAMPCCAGALNVLLWHGLPLKRISWDADFAAAPAPLRAVHADAMDEFDLLALPGDATEPFESGLRIGPDRMAVTGYPRNDALFGPAPGEEFGTDAAAISRVRDLAADHPVICYLPTFREWDPEAVSANVDFAALDDRLAARDAYLVIKPHPKERLDLSDADLAHVLELPENTDVYPLLRHADALVTDYSSVYFDYLLLDRPVAFYAFDRDRYESERGFYFDYEAVAPGPVADDFAELLDALDRLLDGIEDDASDSFADRRREVRASLLGDAASNRRAAARVYEEVRRRLAADPEFESEPNDEGEFVEIEPERERRAN
jgi:CDP-glycerol glycerophosphotransferase (TagB/SpsB family)